MKKPLIFLTGLMTTFFVCGQGTLVFDQQATSGTLASGGSNLQNQQPMGQSFTPSLSTVGFVQFQFLDTSGTQGATVFVNLLANSITGSVIAVSSPVYMPNGFFGITNFFFSGNISVQSGIEYYFRPILQAGDNTSLMGDNYNYSGGTSYFLVFQALQIQISGFAKESSFLSQRVASSASVQRLHFSSLANFVALG